MAKNKILVIDDDPTILEIIKTLLEDKNYIVSTATNGSEGLTNAGAQPLDLILLDRNMPGLSGEETLQSLKSKPETSHIPVIMLTGDQNVHNISKCLEIGAKDYIVKPFDPNNLLVRIKKALG